MSFETHRSYWPATKRSAAPFYVAGALLLSVLAFMLAHAGIEPVRAIVAVPVLTLLLLFVHRFPVALMVAMIDVGIFKPHHAVGFSFTDPTVLTAALLYGFLAFRVLIAATSAEGPRLRELFAGQKWGVISFLLLILVIAISYTYTPAPLIGGNQVLKLTVFDLPIFLAPLVFLRTERDVRQLVLFNLVVSLALAGLTIYRVSHPTAATLLGEEDPTKIGAGLALGIAVLTVLYYRLTNRRLFRLALLASIAVLTVGVAASLSRSAIFGLVLVAGASALFLRTRHGALSRKAILSTLAVLIVAFSVATLWVERLPGTNSKFTAKVTELRLVLQGDDPTGTLGQRYSFTMSAWHAFRAKPVLGWGVGGWSTLWHYTDGRVVKYPHNFILEIAAEQGLLGLAALALLLLAMMSASAKVLEARWQPFAFIVPVIALSLLANAVSGQVDARDMWFWCGTLFALARLSSYQHPLDDYADGI